MFEKNKTNQNTITSKFREYIITKCFTKTLNEPKFSDGKTIKHAMMVMPAHITYLP